MSHFTVAAADSYYYFAQGFMIFSFFINIEDNHFNISCKDGVKLIKFCGSEKVFLQHIWIYLEGVNSWLAVLSFSSVNMSFYSGLSDFC